MAKLSDATFLKFPFEMGVSGPRSSGRTDHVREQIEQVLFTDPGERVFLPEFGVGVRALLFEPNAPVLKEVARKRLLASLAEALRGEVDPRTLEVEVDQREERLLVRISYALAALGLQESHTIDVTGGGGANG